MSFVYYGESPAFRFWSESQNDTLYNIIPRWSPNQHIHSQAKTKGNPPALALAVDQKNRPAGAVVALVRAVPSRAIGGKHSLLIIYD